jgi:hypothetical protein
MVAQDRAPVGDARFVVAVHQDEVVWVQALDGCGVSFEK